MIILLVGASGAGKSTLAKVLDSVGALKVVSTTTRQPRPGEIRDFDYYYITEEEFKQKAINNEMSEMVQYRGNWYGLSKREIERTILSGKLCYSIVDRKGASILQEEYPDSKFVFITVKDPSELERRIRERDPSASEFDIQRRLEGIAEESTPKGNEDCVIYTTSDISVGSSALIDYLNEVCK